MAKKIICDRCGAEVTGRDRYSVKSLPYVEALGYRPSFEDVCKPCVEEMFRPKPPLPQLLSKDPL